MGSPPSKTYTGSTATLCLAKFAAWPRRSSKRLGSPCQTAQITDIRAVLYISRLSHKATPWGLDARRIEKRASTGLYTYIEIYTSGINVLVLSLVSDRGIKFLDPRDSMGRFVPMFPQ